MVIYNPEGTAVISVKVDDSSYVYEEIMGDDNVVLEFALTDHIELEPGSFVLFGGKKYELLNRTDVTIQHTRDYQYKATFSGPQARFSRYVVYNSIDGRVRFDMIGTPLDHLNLVLGNLLLREPGLWGLGSYVVDKPQMLVSYNHTSIKDALNAIAEAFDTEWSVTQEGNGYLINLRKNEFNKDAPLALGYGKNRGFKPGVGRVNYGEFGQVQKAWIDGGERNLSIGEYGWTTLHFPAGLSFLADKNGKLSITVEGTTYSDDGFDGASALEFVTDEWGASVRLADAPTSCNEVSLDLTQFYPKRVGSVTGVQYLYKGQYLTYEELIAAYPNLTKEDWLEIQVDIIDTTIPEDLDYAACCISPDDPMTVIFQDGQLIGREFSAAFYKEAKTRVVDGETVTIRPANRFELVRTSIDGEDMPNAVFRPNTTGTDKYIVVNIYMPEQYICNIEGLEGAEIEALREACKFIQENKDPQFTFKGVVDELYVKRNEGAIGGKLKVGGCISFQDSNIQPEPIVTRIIGIKTYVNNENAPELTLSNETVKGGMSSTLAKLRASDEHVLERVKEGRRFTQRSFRDAKETISMLAGALDYFTEGIHPITVETMSLLVGDQSLQFKFWTDRACTQALVNPVVYDPDTHKVNIPACVIQHMTLDIADVAPSDSRTADEYLRWSMQQYESEALTGVDEQGNDKSATAYYVYAKVDAANVAKPDSQRTEEELTHIGGTFLLSKTKRPFKPTEQDNFYHLLVGILNSEYEGGRSFAPMYGFTEVLPGQITTDVIRSASGDSYFDLANNQFALGNSLQFINNALTLRGALVVNGAGESTEIGAWCGQWNVPAGRQYAKGDEVWWEAPDGTISSYRYINANPSYASSSNDPSHAAYWEVTAKGVAGGEGAHGVNTAVVFLYCRSATQPSALSYSGELTYSFVTNALTSDAPSGWYKRIADVPASDDPLYVTAATAASNTNTDGIEANEWASPVILAENGTDGLNSATVVLYKRASSTPSGTTAKPSGTTRYTFETGVLSVQSGSLQNWSQNVPSGDSPCYRIQATAISTGSYDDIASSEWSSPVKAFENGAEGNGIDSIEDHYAGPTPDGTNHPADSAFVSGRPTPVAGQYIWTRTTITYTDPNKTADKFYSAQYFPTNGTNGDPGAMLVNRGWYDKNEQGEYDLDINGNVVHQTYYGNSQRRDVVYHNGMYYMALANAGEFSNVEPGTTAGNAKWAQFATSLPNVATGLLFAVDTFIENAIVRMLKTSNSGKRVEVMENMMTMYDGESTLPRMTISGENLSGFPQSTTVSFPEQTAMAHSGTNNYDGNGYGFEGDVSTGITINVGESQTVKPGAVLNLPAITFYLQGGFTSTYNGNQMGTVMFRFGWMVDDRQVTDQQVSGWFGKNGGQTSGSYFQQVTLQTASIPLSVGSHTVKLWCNGYMFGCTDGVGLSWFMNGYSSLSANLAISYPTQKTEIGANGFQVAFGSDRMLKCIISGSTTTFLMQSDNVGIELSSSGTGTGTMRIRLGGTWYYAKRTNGVLELSTTP